jgi:hypothetical protein
MLRILGSRRRLCTGPTRRDLLRAAVPGLLGLAASPAAAGRDRPPRFGQARACVLLFLYGSPSQLETFDMKPDAPEEVRGELRPIRSTLPGADVCELLPCVSRVMDRVTVLRSLTHPYPLHGVAYATTGTPAIDVPMELNPRDQRHHPFVGSVVDYLTAGQARAGAAPTNMALPFPFSSRRRGEVPRAGPYAAFLGGAFNPVWTEFDGTPTRRITKTLNSDVLDVAEPYVGVGPDARFGLASGTDRPLEITLDRLDTRRSLVQQFDRARRDLSHSDAGQSLDRARGRAFDLLTSARLREALDLGREAPRLRESYGLTVFGQAALAARRLVEAGSRFVSVFWDEYGLAGSAWDTHWDHFNRMKNELCPGFDRALSGLVNDLDQRGLLDEVLVLVLSEHGRTPKLSRAKGGGRDHWSQAYSAVLAGGGVARGKVIGRTDKIAGSVTERPLSPKDVLATAYHLLGLGPRTTLTDRLGRPVPLVDGEVIAEALG